MRRFLRPSTHACLAAPPTPTPTTTPVPGCWVIPQGQQLPVCAVTCPPNAKPWRIMYAVTAKASVDPDASSGVAGRGK